VRQTDPGEYAIAFLIHFSGRRARRNFFCGSDSFMDRVESSLRSLKVPQAQIHAERFSF
jgi:ferredoxin-NADP reductase